MFYKINSLFFNKLFIVFLTQCLLNLSLNNDFVLKNSTASNLTLEPNYSAVEIKNKF